MNLFINKWLYLKLVDYSFLDPGKIITEVKYCHEINEKDKEIAEYMFSKMIEPFLVNRKGSIILPYISRPHLAQPMIQNFNEIGYKIASSNIVIWTFTNWSPYFQAFQHLARKIFKNQTHKTPLKNLSPTEIKNSMLLE